MPDEGAGHHKLIEPPQCFFGEDALGLVHGVPQGVAVLARLAGEQLKKTARAASDPLDDALANRRGVHLDLADLLERHDEHSRVIEDDLRALEEERSRRRHH